MLSYIHTLYSACLLSPKEGRKEEYAELHRLQNFTHVARCATIGEIRSRMRHSPQNKLVIPWIIDNHDRTLRIRLVHLPTATIARKQNCHRLDDIQQRKNKRKKKKTMEYFGNRFQFYATVATMLAAYSVIDSIETTTKVNTLAIFFITHTRSQGEACIHTNEKREKKKPDIIEKKRFFIYNIRVLSRSRLCFGIISRRELLKMYF